MGYVDRILGAGEEKLYVAHRHILFLAARVALRVLIAVAAIVAAVIIRGRTREPVGTVALAAFTVVALVFLVQVVFLWLQWRNEEYVVTARRVIQTRGVFGKNTWDSSLNMINDIATRQSLWGRLFNFGDVDIVTGNDDPNELHGVADPFAFKRAMLAAKEQVYNVQYAGTHAAAPDTIGHEDIPGLIAQLADLRDRGALSEADFAAKRDDLLRRL